MELSEWVTVTLAVLGFLGAIIATSVFVTWRISQVATDLQKALAAADSSLRDLIAQERAEVDRKISAARKECDTTAESARREIGETMRAMQSKIHEFEKWARDNFIRRDSFILVTRELKDGMQAQASTSDRRLNAIDSKLDRLIERLIPPLV